MKVVKNDQILGMLLTESEVEERGYREFDLSKWKDWIAIQWDGEGWERGRAQELHLKLEMPIQCRDWIQNVYTDTFKVSIQSR